MSEQRFSPSDLTENPSPHGPAINPAFDAALEKHVAKLTTVEREAFQAASKNITPEELVFRTQEYDKKHSMVTSFRQCTSSVEKFLNFIERFMGGVAIGIQASPDISCLVVGAVRIVIDVSHIRYKTIFR